MTFGGHASDATVAAAYAQSDVLVVTSEHEGYCVPVVEAMTVGLPVVAFRQGALPEVLGDGGVLVDSKDPYTLVRRPSAPSWRDAVVAGPAGAAGRRTALAELDLATAADRFVDLALRRAGASAAVNAA